jgi:hypothetical protein
MEICTYQRHAISDEIRMRFGEKKLEPHLPGRQGSWGGIAVDNRRRSLGSSFWFLCSTAGAASSWIHPQCVAGDLDPKHWGGDNFVGLNPVPISPGIFTL